MFSFIKFSSVLSQVNVGEIVAYSSETIQTGFLECNGASLVRTDYADLFTAIGTVWGTADATHFNLPDLRGRFPRGWAHGQTTDPDRASRTASNTGGETGDKVGSIQDSQFVSHSHTYNYYPSNLGLSVAESSWYVVAGQVLTGAGGGGAESRPINTGAMFIIRYM